VAPQNLRYHLLNSDEPQVIRLGVWSARSNRLDVYYDGHFVMPTNGETRDDTYILKSPTTPGQYMPNVASDPAGTNYMDRETSIHYVIVKGPLPVEVKLNPQILVSFSLPTMSEEDFFAENIIRNLALFLNIPPNKVRLVAIVSEQGGSGGRRRRAVDHTIVYLEVGDEPLQGQYLDYGTTIRELEGHMLD
jgi:hypothetical protein